MTPRAVVWPVDAHFYELVALKVSEFQFCAAQRPSVPQLKDRSTVSSCPPIWHKVVQVFSLYVLATPRSQQLTDHHFALHDRTSLLFTHTLCQWKKSSDLQCVFPAPYLTPCLAKRDREGASISHCQMHLGVWLQQFSLSTCSSHTLGVRPQGP